MATTEPPTTQIPWKPSPFRGVSRNVFLLSVVSLLTDLSSEMIYPLVPLFLSRTLGAPVAIVGVIEGIAEATASFFKWISGALSDRWGRRKPFAFLGYGLAAFTKPMLALASGWPLVLAARVLDRFGKGLRGSPRDALIADSTPAELRGRAFGFHRSGDSIGAVLGPLLALVVITYLHESFRQAFLIAFIPGALSTLTILAVRDRQAEKHRRPLFAHLRFGTSNPGLRRFLLVNLVFSIGNSSDMFLILRARQFGGTASVLLMFALCNALNVVSSYPAGIVSDRLGRRHVLVAGFALFAAVYLGFGLTGTGAVLWALFALYGVYQALTQGISSALVVDLVPAQERGSALGLLSLVIGICTLPASMIAGALWQFGGPRATFLYGSATAAAAAILMAVLFRPSPRAS